VREIFPRSKESPWAGLSLGHVREKPSRDEVYAGEDLQSAGTQTRASPGRDESLSRLAGLERKSRTESACDPEFYLVCDSKEGVVNKMDDKENLFVEPEQFVGVQFECSKCHEKAALPLLSLTPDRIWQVFEKHRHADSDSGQMNQSKINAGQNALSTLLTHLTAISSDRILSASFPRIARARTKHKVRRLLQDPPLP
jgi:hypothetical protein